MPSFTDQQLEALSKPELISIIRSQEARIAQLEARVADLEEKLAVLLKNSRNSFKPPSSDIVKPPKPRSSGSRKAGGQTGHPGFWHRFFSAEKIDEIKEHRFSECPDCQTPLGPEHQTKPWIQQTAEIPERLIRITEHHDEEELARAEKEDLAEEAKPEPPKTGNCRLF